MVHQNADINRVPSGGYDINDNPRDVYIVHRDEGGAIGGWAGRIPGALFSRFEEIGKLYGDTVPDLSHHWAVQVGKWYHQLQVKDGNNFYENDEFSRYLHAWDVYKVGSTKFNDVAIVSAGT